MVGGHQPRAGPSDRLSWMELKHTYRYRETAYEGKVDGGRAGKGVRTEVISKEYGLL